MSEPQISILTPVWNGMPYLKECIDSVLQQDFQEWELLISDDVSTDESPGYLASLDDPRISIVRQENNLGIFGNLNFLSERARAPICYILCQDDYFLPGGLAEVMRCWSEQSDDIGAIRFNHGEIDTAQSLFVRRQRQMLPEVMTPDESAMCFFVFGNLLSNLSNNSLRTRLISEVGMFDQSFPYAGDFEFWSRLAQQCSIRFQDSFVTYIRRHPQTASALLNKNGELVAQLHRIVERLGSEFAREPGFLTRLHVTAYYDSIHRYLGVRQALLGRKSTYLNAVDEAAAANPWVLGRTWRWFVFLLTLGGRINQIPSAKMIMRRYASINGLGEAA